MADGILAISASAANEVQVHTDIAHKRVINISSATDDHFKIVSIDEIEKKRLLKTYGITGEFVMTIGVLEQRKNIEALIHAYGLLSPEVRSAHTLVLACQIKPHDKARLKSLALKHGLQESEIAFTGFIPDEDLVALYNICKLFVFPSIHEGFGLPPLEAMCCGAATIASNTTSLPEVMGWDGAMFDPHNVTDMARMMEKALTDEIFRQELLDNAKHQASLFSWDKCAQTAVDAFERSLKRDSVPTLLPETALGLAVKKIRNIAQPDLSDLDKLGAAWSLAKNSYRTHQKQLLVDISVLVQHDARTGIQRVVRSVLACMLEQGYEGYSVRAVYCQMGQLFHYANRYVADNYGADYGDDEPVLFAKGDILLGLDLTAHLFPYLNTQLDHIRKTGAQVYYIVYDLIPLLHPEWTDTNVRAAFPLWIKSLAEHTDGLVCISNSVAQELEQWLQDNAGQIHTNPYLKIGHFHLGADIDASAPSAGRPDNADYILHKMSGSPVFLMVSTVEPRKGHAQVLAAFDKLWLQGVDCTLVIVGKKGWGVDELAAKIEGHSALNKKLFWLSGIGDDFLSEIYSRAQVLIVASLAEGFGLPIIEAAQQGLPIIARDIPVLREVAGEHAFYFQGETPESVEKAVLDWLELNAGGRVPDSKNIPWLTWQESTQQLLAQLPLSKLQ
ncbi:glycosyltransferase family 4 protein [Sodalis sp. RH21]|uniref:glycosyltransferase family 4 protein n=1 Tax=unclassified Sodalis (in: enterobacteria) TaxID=2636512 RepID=UPI0039B638AC